MLVNMKILHVIPEFRKGGAERLAYDICYYLNQIPEIDVKLITFKENPLNKLCKDSFYKHIPSFYQPSITSRSKKSIERLQQFINSFNPDVVHSHLWETEMLLSKLKFINAKRIVHFHDNIKQLKKIKIPIKKKDITNLYEKKIFVKTELDYILTISKDNLEYAKKVLPNGLRKKIIKLPNAINFNNFFQNKKRKLESIKLINVSSFLDKKNQVFALEIVKELVIMNYNVNIDFLGKGPCLKNCKELAKSLGIVKSVNFKGNIENVKEFYEKANVYLHTAKYEPFGLVLLEAMATGLPVVCLDGKGNRDFIEHNKNGFIFKTQNAKIFANQILKLVKNKRLYNEIAINGQKTARNYDIKNYIENLLKIYKN